MKKLSKAAIQMATVHRAPRLRLLSTFTNPTCQKLNKRISHLIRCGNLDGARKLFDSMKYKNIVTWNSMLTGYTKRREISNARKFFEAMPERDVVSYNLMISGYVSCGGERYVREGRKLFDEMPDRDLVSWNTMLSGYFRNGMVEDGVRMFEGMSQRNVVTWNAMISGFLQNGEVGRAVEFFGRMPERDAATLSAIVSGLLMNDELDRAEQVLAENGDVSGEEGGDLIHAYNTLIAGYGQRGKVDDARRLFDQIPCNSCQGEAVGKFKRNVVTWNSMIMCYVKAGDVYSARGIFDQMSERDDVSWNTMISGYVHASDMEEASNLFCRMPNPDTESWNLMVSGFAQIGNLKLARDFFERTPSKTCVSWNSIIDGYDKNKDHDQAIKHYIKMQVEGIKPDRHTLSSVLSVCAGYVTLQLGMQIHQQVTKLVVPDLPINNSLITMYSTCGAIAEARTMFDEMKLQKDVISWNAMIKGYASHGFAAEALELFELMKKLKVHPSYITFIAVLNACAHAGLVEEGRSHFETMVNKFKIKPRVEHFASLVDIVGRYGQLEEAMDLINSMPFEPDKAVWGALLGACRVHNNVEYARVAAEALMNLEPENSAPYVLLSNIYADAGQWDDATGVRMKMDEKNINKHAASSWVGSSCSNDA